MYTEQYKTSIKDGQMKKKKYLYMSQINTEIRSV